MWILYILFTIICCYVTAILVEKHIVTALKNNDKGFELHQEYIFKSLYEIAQVKTDVIQIKKDIYQ